MAELITSTDVADELGLSVNAVDIRKAQRVIFAAYGLDLSLENLEDIYSARDIRVLKAMVIAQVQFNEANPGLALSPSNVSSESTNGNSVSYTSTGARLSDRFVAPLTASLAATLDCLYVSSGTIFVNPSDYNPRVYDEERVWFPLGRTNL